MPDGVIDCVNKLASQQKANCRIVFNDRTKNPIPDDDRNNHDDDSIYVETNSVFSDSRITLETTTMISMMMMMPVLKTLMHA